MGGQSFLPAEILDYVDTHAPGETSPYGISQRELAKALGYHPCSMSRPLNQLVIDGLLSCRRGLVRDGQRRQLVYRITDPGRNRLNRETKKVPLLAGAIPPPPNPFLGRREELEQLTAAAKRGRSITLIDGPPGMGKTSLISRHIRWAKRGRIPFWFSVRPASSPRQFVASLSHALSFLGSPQLAYYSQLPRAPVAREVADLTVRALGDRELVVVVDDVQMADTNFRGFLLEFITDLVRSSSHQVYLVGQELPTLEAGDLPVARLTVGGLDRTAAHDLTDRRGGLAERFESVYQSTFGSPLLLQLAVSNPGLEADAANLPRRVVERLPSEDVLALIPLALSNEPLPPSFVVRPGKLTAPRLGEALRMGVLQRTQQGRLEMLQVVRSALLGRVSQAEERDAHLELAEFYAGSHRPEALRERFLHLVDAESWKAASRLLATQERALFVLGYSDALRGALRHLSVALPRSPAKVRVLFAEAALLRHHSDYAESINTLRRAHSEAGYDGRAACEALLLIVDLLARLHQTREAQQALREAERIGPLTRRLQVLLLLSRARVVEAQGQGQTARPMYQSAFELARRFRVTDLALESIAAWSRLEELESGPEVAIKIVGDALPEARQAGRMDIAFNLLLVRARAYFRIGQVELAESEMKQVRAEAESLGYLNQLAYSFHGLAATAFESARWVEGIAYAKQALALAERLGNDLVLGHTLALVCTAEVRQSAGGDPHLIKDAIGYGKRSVEVLSRLPPSEALAFAHSYLADAYVHDGDPETATRHFDESLRLCDSLGLAWLRQAIEGEIGAKLHQGTPPNSLEEGLGPHPGG